MRTKQLILSAICLFTAANVFAGLSGFLTNQPNGGLTAGGETWGSTVELKVTWIVSQNSDGTWHYQYRFTNWVDELMTMHDVSHFIIEISSGENPFLESDILGGIIGDYGDHAIEIFGLSPGNPGFPEGLTIYGLKIDLDDEHTTVEFDSTRSPMWGDFYAKGGGKPKNFAYNSNFGTEAVNKHDYANDPADATGNSLFKVLVPNTVPEPTSLLILGFGGLLLVKSRR